MADEQTYGEKIVRVKFNPSGDNKIDSFKSKVAELINEIHATGKDPRNTAQAITHLETASMFAVKSLTA